MNLRQQALMSLFADSEPYNLDEFDSFEDFMDMMDEFWIEMENDDARDKREYLKSYYADFEDFLKEWPNCVKPR